jgi:threonine dehydrogenase-like Zn-dependent dehydrogenase
MGTGHYAALLAGVHPGGTVAIVGDGAVGLCGVLAARRLGGERIILLGHRAQRLELARRFGATDLITNRGEQAEREVIELTAEEAESVMECVGTKESMDAAIAIVCPGGSIGYVGVPRGSEQLNLEQLFFARSHSEVGGTCSSFSPRVARGCAGRTARSFSCARSHRRSRWRSIWLRCAGSAHSHKGHGPTLEG